MVVGGRGGGGRKGRTTRYGRFLDAVWWGGEGGRMTTHGRFLDPVMVKGKVGT